MGSRLIVVGGVAAGMSAAAKAKRVNREMEVVVYEKSPYISYAACGMPYYIAGDILDHRRLLARTPEQMAKQGVEVHVRHEVTGIDSDAQVVTVRDLEEEREFTQPYDKLVLATGATTIRPSIPGLDLAGVHELRALEDGIVLRRALAGQADGGPRRAVIVGGGYVGVEMAETFRRLGLEVTMLIRSGQVMRKALDDDVRALLEEELARQGVEVVKAKPIAFEGNGHVAAVVAEDGRYPCDIVLLGIGVSSGGVSLAQAAGVALGTTGAIATDDHMRTNVPDVYAAGDCAEVFHLVTGEPAYIPLGSTANKQGRVAGENAAGGEASFDGVVGTMVVRGFDLALARTGLTEAEARAAGYAARGTMIKAMDRPGYFPGAAPIHVKLVADEETDRLLGGQIAGEHGVAKRIDVLATALHHKLTVTDLRRLDLSYAPPFAPVWDPILVAANVAAK
jgi:NADPH-dependent 2,4-dienoyl-CoA reductase/sulfur reductase-like enzyme